MRAISTVFAVALAALAVACTQGNRQGGEEGTGATETISIEVSGMT